MSYIPPNPDTEKSSVVAIVGAVVIAFSLFLIVPLTQILAKPPSKIVEYREIVTIKPPLPPTPPSKDIEPLKEPEPAPPEFKQPTENLQLNPLDLTLNPGTGDAIAMGVRTREFESEIDVMGDIEKIFTFADLPQAPRILNTPRITFPKSLTRRGIKDGKVVLLVEIDQKGRARVLKIISSSHPKLEPVAKDVVKRALFTTPEIEGETVTVRGEWPLYLQAPR